MDAPLRVHRWPHESAQALAALQSDVRCVVISVVTLHTENRMLAREAIRAALQELLAAYWQSPAESIIFSTHIGRAPTLLSPASALGLSISHAAGCSVAAVHLHCAVGIDVMRTPTDLAGRDGAPSEMERLAQDYLGPATHRLLVQTALSARALAFAQAWSQLEAKLKCLGLGLTEWTTTLEQALGNCKATVLDLPGTLCGALAVGPDTRSTAVAQRGFL